MYLLNVIPTSDYLLILHYSNYEVRVYDVKPLLNKGVFKKLKNIKSFYTVRINGDSVEWPNMLNNSMEIDIAPESLYEDSVLLENMFKTL